MRSVPGPAGRKGGYGRIHGAIAVAPSRAVRGKAGVEMFWVGTSGYNYPEWKGSFYPEKFSAAKMLPYYAERFSTVEINYTFYRLPTDKVMESWAEATPSEFAFTLKASRRITHDARLKDCQDLVDYFYERARKLGPKLGVLLFQLPPWLRKDLELSDSFLGGLPSGVRAAFEFRHDSWHSAEVFARLRDRNLALCIADTDKKTTPLEVTADYAYFRLRDEGYQPDDIARWGDKIAESTTGCSDVFVYFKHEEQGKGPEFARAMIASLEAH